MYTSLRGLTLIIDRALWICFPEILHFVLKAGSNKKSLGSRDENHILQDNCVHVYLKHQFLKSSIFESPFSIYLFLTWFFLVFLEK